MKETYTPRQLEILRFIVDFRQKRDVSPTLEEIGNALGIHRVTVHQHIAVLEQRGAVKRTNSYRRNIIVTDPELTGEVELPEDVQKLIDLINQHRDEMLMSSGFRSITFDDTLKEIVKAADKVLGNPAPEKEGVPGA